MGRKNNSGKIIKIVLLILFVSGCNNQEDSKVPLNIIDNNYIVSPFSAAVDEGIINNNVDSNYDLYEIEAGLLRHSKKYFSPLDYYYESGKILTRDYLKELIEKLNEDEAIKVDYIYEQNFKNKEDDLKGMSLGIIVNLNDVEITEEDFEEKVKIKIGIINKFLENIDEAKKIKKVIGIYLEEKEETLIPGNYRYKILIDNNRIGKLINIDEKYYLFPTALSKERDLNTYNFFKKIETEFQEKSNSPFSVVGRGFYLDGKCQSLFINVDLFLANNTDVLSTAQFLQKTINENTNYSLDFELNILVKNNDKVRYFIIKEKNKQAAITTFLTDF